eukprot:6199382-Pleurochrysis_carterae.AAC.1
MYNALCLSCTDHATRVFLHLRDDDQITPRVLSPASTHNLNNAAATVTEYSARNARRPFFRMASPQEAGASYTLGPAKTVRRCYHDCH